MNLLLFDILVTSIFFWEILPEWMFPLLTGFSIFCLANPRSADFTRIFGGSGGNEGLGFLSICLDWQYISGSNEVPYCIIRKLIFWSPQLPILWRSLWKHNFLCASDVYWACEATILNSSSLHTQVPLFSDLKGCLLWSILHEHLEINELPLGALLFCFLC